MSSHTTWKEAHTIAQADANRFQRPMGLEKAREYGREVFRVKMIPKNPNDRYGWETQCEIIEPMMSKM